jgi:hypothetical protein
MAIKHDKIEGRFLDKDLNKVNLNEAILEDHAADEQIENYYERSALAFIFRSLINDGIIRDRISNLFIEFSNIVSIYDEEKLDAHVLTYQRERNSKNAVFKKKVETNFPRVINYLREKGQTLFNHPNFLLNAPEAACYFSHNDNRSCTPEDQLANKLNDFKVLNLNPKTKRSTTKLKKCQDKLKDRVVFINAFGRELPISYDDLLENANKSILPVNALCGCPKECECDELSLRHKFNHMLYDEAFCKNTNSESIFLSIPLVVVGSNLHTENSDESRRDEKGLGAIFIYIQLKQKGEDSQDQQASIYSSLLRERLINFTQSIPGTIKDVAHGYSFQILKKKEREAKSAAVHAAVAAIMSRNLSHNLGSHVFYYTRETLNNLVLQFPKKDENLQYIITENDESNLKGVSWFLSYLQDRHDFIASINSGEQLNFGPLNLKQDVVDAITPDAVDFRHQASTPTTNNHLLDFIVKSEQFHRNVATLKKPTGRKKDKRNIEIEIKFKSITSANFLQFRTHDQDFKSIFYDLVFAVQGGVVGTHAFLSIFENIIRNTAKHAKIEENLVLTVEVSELENKYKIDISDNGIVTQKQFNLIANKYNDLMLFDEATDGVSAFEINREAKGLKEILVCVMWLKGKDLVGLQSRAMRNDNLQINHINGNLHYQFEIGKYYFAKSSTSNESTSTPDTNPPHNNEPQCAFKFHQEKSVAKDCPQSPRIIKHSTDDFVESDHEKIYEEFLVKSGFNNWPALHFSRLHTTLEINPHNVSDASLRITFRNHLNKNMQSLYEKIIANTTYEEILFDSDKTRIIQETISGANQTFNLFQKFSADQNDKLLYYNVVEAYKTRILIIDERMSFKDPSKQKSKKYKHKNNIWEYYHAQKNTFLFNLRTKGLPLLVNSCGPLPINHKEIKVDFLTIHLGLLDKLPGNSLLDKINDITQKNHIRYKYLSIHSGRGGLNNSKDKVTFIPFATLQKALEDSKFALSELFYSRFYFPK